MFVDASALSALALEEPDHVIYAEALDRSQGSFITSFVLMEAGLALMKGRGLRADDAHDQIEIGLKQFRIETVELTSPMILTALKAHERFGKGRNHPAKLNMGDCLSYGAARVLGLPLLYKGDDFSKTDIVPALPKP
jgi:ribonuclease VapC